MDAVNVVVTCTKDKTSPVDPECALRAVPEGTVRERFVQWRRRLSQRGRLRVRVEDLYSGDHWATVRAFHSSRFAIHVWVCSAGYGLVSLRDSITPYSATFSATHPDSVSRNVIGTSNGRTSQAWWKQATKWKGRAEGKPRSLRDLAAEYPNRAMLIVASETYLRAISGDLREAVDTLSDPDLLSIISAGSKSLEGLDGHLIPCDARLQTLVSGARRSLNTRVAGMVLSQARVVPRRPSLIKKMQRLLSEQPEIQRYDRTPMSDTEVQEFIAQKLRSDSHLSHTPLLRILRESGHACEQKRFASLYRIVKEQINGAP